MPRLRLLHHGSTTAVFVAPSATPIVVAFGFCAPFRPLLGAAVQPLLPEYAVALPTACAARLASSSFCELRVRRAFSLHQRQPAPGPGALPPSATAEQHHRLPIERQHRRQLRLHQGSIEREG